MQVKAHEVRKRVNAIAGSVRISVTELAAASRVDRSLLSKFLSGNLRTLPIDQLERIDLQLGRLGMRRLRATIDALTPKVGATK